MSTKHTPGPWRFEASTKTIRAEPSNYWLATMDSWDGAVNHEANARLIAAAPEMLELLRYTSEMLQDCRALLGQDGEVKGIHAEIQTLIARIEGES